MMSIIGGLDGPAQNCHVSLAQEIEVSTCPPTDSDAVLPSKSPRSKGKVAVHVDDIKLSELVEKSPCDLLVKDLRNFIPRLFNHVEHNDERRRTPGLWAPGKKPRDWPDHVPFVDPNNGGKSKKKPSKEVLHQMFKYLVSKYKQQEEASVVKTAQSVSELCEEILQPPPPATEVNMTSVTTENLIRMNQKWQNVQPVKDDWLSTLLSSAIEGLNFGEADFEEVGECVSHIRDCHQVETTLDLLAVFGNLDDRAVSLEIRALQHIAEKRASHKKESSFGETQLEDCVLEEEEMEIEDDLLMGDTGDLVELSNGCFVESISEPHYTQQTTLQQAQEPYYVSTQQPGPALKQEPELQPDSLHVLEPAAYQDVLQQQIIQEQRGVVQKKTYSLLGNSSGSGEPSPAWGRGHMPLKIVFDCKPTTTTDLLLNQEVLDGT